ncbi:unnamed protein product [Haemonchus placei]|uniref:Uncharacterized protein n=1 Tax=Haemonchus placei TaxID=6290 RepID=A0A0N4WQW2_HAEPC|nr:unnamed protein product [Haemonchus placei]
MGTLLIWVSEHSVTDLRPSTRLGSFACLEIGYSQLLGNLHHRPLRIAPHRIPYNFNPSRGGSITVPFGHKSGSTTSFRAVGASFATDGHETSDYIIIVVGVTPEASYGTIPFPWWASFPNNSTSLNEGMVVRTTETFEAV